VVTQDLALKTLGQLRLESCGVRVNALRRGDIRGDLPSVDMVLREGDALVLEGPARALVKAEERLLRGA